MCATVLHGFHPCAPDLPPSPAGADEPEADPPETVAADPSVVDSESDPSYRDRVHTDQSEAERQAWLRRVQAQPIR